MELTTNVMPAFDQLRAYSKKDIHVSTMGLSITDAQIGHVTGYLGLYTGGAVRLDVNDDGDVVQVAIWRKPGDLNKPDIKLDVSHDDIFNQIPKIARALNGEIIGEDFLAAERRLVEGARDDVSEFVGKNPSALEGRVADAYAAYMKWASKNGKKEMSAVYFSNNLRAIKAEGGVNVNASKPAPEQTDIEPDEADLFAKDVMDNEIYYKAAMYESTLRRMAQGDPGITSLFVYGSPGLGKTYECKKIMKEEGVWETNVVYKSGAIAGFTGLLQLLWDNRKGKIIILDDNDNLLAPGGKNQAAANVLKAVLNSDPDDRIVSYVKMRK